MRSFWIAVSLALSPVLAVAGCATSSTVQGAPLTQGASHDFDAPYDVVKAAALEAVGRLNINIQGSDETAERFQIRFSKPISAFSWGEVGVVNVVRVDDQHTRVFVNSEKRDQMQLTGTSERQFAEQIFANITESLARLQP
jgi:hypothetical protein